MTEQPMNQPNGMVNRNYTILVSIKLAPELTSSLKAITTEEFLQLENSLQNDQLRVLTDRISHFEQQISASSRINYKIMKLTTEISTLTERLMELNELQKLIERGMCDIASLEGQ
ncbi:hypothetical protein UA08_00476 [Talaromyces atroroseus]|uniref:Uncharacterized protein n=1 Tax=Talaromyces atroroseus TaxID=1441469 RepID=A0A225AZP6_TALAT|nr:hypothetical protein UA08_00476 [Talaromyces atroroseus]OKL63924.1 hypothetical protein UA08_00476 [Talaromyces atroroseus]